MQNNSASITIVLVNTSHSGNIGATARAMKTMGLSQLVLVDPQDDYQSEQAIAMAAGAKDILAQAKVVTRLEEAVADCELVFATSARDRARPWPMLAPREMALKTVAEAQQEYSVAIVFGRERTGLTNQELQLAHYHIQIPANPAYCSLNLSQAVQIICYEIQVAYVNMQASAKVKNQTVSEYADSKTLENFYQHLESLLVKIRLINPKKPMQTMMNLRRLFNRGRLELSEVRLLRGVLSKIEKLLG